METDYVNLGIAVLLGGIGVGIASYFASYSAINFLKIKQKTNEKRARNSILEAIVKNNPNISADELREYVDVLDDGEDEEE